MQIANNDIRNLQYKDPTANNKIAMEGQINFFNVDCS